MLLDPLSWALKDHELRCMLCWLTRHNKEACACAADQAWLTVRIPICQLGAGGWMNQAPAAAVCRRMKANRVRIR